MRLIAAVTLMSSLLLAPELVPPVEAPPTLTGLAFMAGCWRGESGDGVTIEEYYTAPTENLILGLTRYTRRGRVTSYEFSTIAREDTAIILTPRPAGQEPAPFRLTRFESQSAVWENPAHDYPTLIAYRRSGDSLVARIEGPGREGKRSFEWRMGRASCGG
jgi:hypothetical protein